MNFVVFLAQKYFVKEKWAAFALFFISLAYSFFQTNVLTVISSYILTFAQDRNERKVKSQ